MSKKCPKCGNKELIKLDSSSAKFECKNYYCGQRMDNSDYINWSLKNYHHKIDMGKILELCIEGVEKGV